MKVTYFAILESNHLLCTNLWKVTVCFPSVLHILSMSCLRGFSTVFHSFPPAYVNFYEFYILLLRIEEAQP